MKLENLIVLTNLETTTTPTKKVFAKGLGIILGIISSLVFIPANKRFVAGANKPYQYLIIGSSIGINAIVNGYFNVIAADEFFDFWDPVTKKLLIPKSHLAGILFFSTTSAICFAFLDLDPPFYIDFSFEVLTYTAQHFFAINDAYDCIPQKAPQNEDETQFRVAKKEMIQKIDLAIMAVYEHFQKGNDAKEFLNANDNSINLKSIRQWVERQEIKPIDTQSINHCRQKAQGIGYYSIQFIAAAVTTAGNICFHNVAINGFLTLHFSLYASWGMASFFIIPVYGIAYILTKRTVDQVLSMLKDGIMSMPYFIRNNLLISLLLGAPLITMGIFSYGSSKRITQEAIYPIEASNPPHFQGLDNDQRQLENLWSYCATFATIIFNSFPVGTVVESCIKNLKYYLLGTTAEKQQIKVLDFFSTLRRRVVKMSFTPETKFDSNSSLQEPLLNVITLQ